MLPKKMVALFVVCSMLLTLICQPIGALKLQTDENLNINTSCIEIEGQQYYSDSAPTCEAIGTFYQDNFMNISWLVKQNDGDYTYEALIPRDKLAPFCNSNGNYNLCELISSLNELNIEKYATAFYEKTSSANIISRAGNSMQKEAVRERLGEVEPLHEYDGREIRTSYVYNPAVLAVFESRHVRVTEMLDFRTFASGLTLLSVATGIAGLAKIGSAAAMGFLSTTLGIAGTVLPYALTVEKYYASIDYSRTGGYKNADEQYYTLCNNINEEYSIAYTALVSPSKATGSDYTEVTALVDGPNYSYLNSEETYSIDNILNRTYKEYQRMT